MFTSHVGRGRCIAIALVVLYGCSRAAPAAHPVRPRINPDEISQTEIESQIAWRTTSLYEIVRAVRPRMLIARNPALGGMRSSIPTRGSVDGIKVYLDGTLLGGVEALKTIPTGSVSTVRHLSAIEATARLGTGHTDGAIIVISRGGPGE